MSLERIAVLKAEIRGLQTMVDAEITARLKAEAEAAELRAELDALYDSAAETEVRLNAKLDKAQAGWRTVGGDVPSDKEFYVRAKASIGNSLDDKPVIYKGDSGAFLGYWSWASTWEWQPLPYADEGQD